MLIQKIFFLNIFGFPVPVDPGLPFDPPGGSWGYLWGLPSASLGVTWGHLGVTWGYSLTVVHNFRVLVGFKESGAPL